MRILLAEHHPQVRRALQTLLKEEREYELVGQVADLKSLIEQAKLTQPDVVLLDWELPRCNEGLMPSLRKIDCCPSLIVMSSQLENEEEALRVGADAFVSKGEPPQKLLDALEKIKKEVECNDV